MKRGSKKKGQRKNRKKGGTGKFFFFLIVIGLVVLMVYLFRQEIFHSLKPFLEKKPEKKVDIKERKVDLKEKKIVTLFFSEEEGEYLVGERREILKQGDVREQAKETINELIKGPRSKLIRTLPPRTKLLALQISEKGVAKVDFNKSLSKEHPGGSSTEIMTIYSIVNSLTLNFPQIKGVQILIEGETGESIAGHLILDQPISSKTDLIRK